MNIYPRITIGNAELNVETQAFHVGGKEVHLTAFEYLVLHYLMQAHGRLIPAAEIESVLYPEERAPSNVLQVIVSRLRHKLVKADVTWRIRTLRGRGYRIAAYTTGGGS